MRIAVDAGVPWYRSLAAAFAADRPDGVIVATPNKLHVHNGLECVDAGVAVLVEKPIADTVAEGRLLVDAAEARGVPLLIGHHRRHSPLIAKAAEIVRQGTLGRLVAVMGSAVYYKPDDARHVPPARRRRIGPQLRANVAREQPVSLP